MDIDKALDILKRLRIALATANVDGDRVLDPLSIAIEAPEKQIPKKPSEVEEDLRYFECGNCNGVIYSGSEMENHKYCLNCGQKIDWSKEETYGTEN